jgi:hypothetical protein
MKSSLVAMLCRTLIVSLFFFSFHVSAGMIGTEQVGAVSAAQTERMQIQSVLSRAEVASQLQALGIDMKTAQERVAALTDDEARSLAGKLDSIPAGASSDTWWIVGIIAVAVIAWWYFGRR